MVSKKDIIQNSLFLTVRSWILLFIRSIGIIVIIRFVVPYEYGVFVTCLSFCTFVFQSVHLGINTYIVRSAFDRLNDVKRIITNSFLLLSFVLLVTIVVLVLIFPFLSFFMKVPVLYLYILSFASVFSSLETISVGLLEKAFKYGSIATIDIISQLCYYAIALPLIIYFKLGVMGMIYAYLFSQILHFLLFSVKTKCFSMIDVRLIDMKTIKDIFKFGFGYISANLVYNAKNLIHPFILAPLSDYSVVGNVALAERVIDSLSFICDMMKRLFLSYLAKVKGDIIKFSTAIYKGIIYQLLLIEVSLIILILGFPLIQLILKKDWMDLKSIIPFVAISLLFRGILTIPTSSFYINSNGVYVAIIYAISYGINILSLVVNILIFKPIKGYCYSFFSYFLLGIVIMFFIKKINKFYISYKNIFGIYVVFVSFSIALFFIKVHWILILFVLVPFFFRFIRSYIVDLFCWVKCRNGDKIYAK